MSSQDDTFKVHYTKVNNTTVHYSTPYSKTLSSSAAKKKAQVPMWALCFITHFVSVPSYDTSLLDSTW